MLFMAQLTQELQYDWIYLTRNIFEQEHDNYPAIDVTNQCRVKTSPSLVRIYTQNQTGQRQPTPAYTGPRLATQTRLVRGQFRSVKVCCIAFRLGRFT
jgi:hypothetical protein